MHGEKVSIYLYDNFEAMFLCHMLQKSYPLFLGN